MGRALNIIYDDSKSKGKGKGRALYQNGGKTVVRVQYDIANNTYILLDGKKKIVSRKDKGEITYEYYKYIRADAIEHTTNERPISLDAVADGIDGGGDVEITIKEDGTVSAVNVAELAPDVLCSMFAQLYYKDPISAEALTQIPNLSKLASMDFARGDKEPKVKMDEILEAYCSNPAYENKPHLIKEATQYWNEFRLIINRQAGHKVKYLRDINPAWIKVWGNEIYKVATQRSYTKAYWLTQTQRNELGRVKQYPRNSWQRKRVYGIRGLLKHYKKEKIYDPNSPKMKQIKDVEYTLSTVTAFEAPKPLPKTITPEQFKQLYNGASDRMKMMLCLSVQCAFTNIDLYNLRKDDIDWTTGELNKMREKENKPRVAYISPLLLKMMQDYMKKNNGTTDYIIVEKGVRVTALAIRKEFKKLREQLDLPKSIQFKQLRKTAITKAAKYGASDLAVKLLAGHSAGISDAYLEKTVEHVKSACISIAEEYFPKE